MTKLHARVEALEAKYETMRLATLEWGKDVDNMKRWLDKHHMRLEALETAGSAVTPFDEEENDRRFHACMGLIKNATPEQIRAAAGLPEPSSLVERVSDAIVRTDQGHDWQHADTIATDEARAAICAVAAWFGDNATPGTPQWIAAADLTAEIER